MQQLDAILFDLDGTLLDTAPDFFVVINQLCEHHQKPTVNMSDVRATVSHGSRAMITLAFGLREGDAQFDNLRKELLQLYSDHLAVKTQLFPGLKHLLNWLDNERISWGIVTNKPRLYTDAVLTALSLAERCHTVVCPDDVTRTKPDPEPLFLACQQLSCAPNNTIYVGDHRRDIEAGQRAGMVTIAAGYGYIDPCDPSESWGADHHIDKPESLLSLIQCDIFTTFARD